MKRFKILAILLIALVGIIIFLQNTGEVETRLLFFTVTMPRALLLFTTTLIGFLLGVLVSLLVMKKRKTSEHVEKAPRG